MGKGTQFEDLKVWQKSRELHRQVYCLTEKGRFKADHALCSQIRRASLSVMSNIAEGFERGGDREFIQFLSQAKESCGEVRSQLFAAGDPGYLDEKEFGSVSELAVETCRMISGLIRNFKESGYRGSKFK